MNAVTFNCYRLTQLLPRTFLYQLILFAFIGSFHKVIASQSTDAVIHEGPQVSTPPMNPLWSIPLAPVSLLIPGAGHYVRGEKEISYKLFRSGAGSILTFLVSGSILAVTGAADAVILPMVPLTLFAATSWFSLSVADLVGMNLNQTSKLNYKHRFLSNWSAFIRYRRIDDYSFDTKGYYQLGGEIWRKNKVVSGSVETIPNGKIAIYNADFGFLISKYNKYKPKEGLYIHGGFTYEDNQPGYYQQYSLTYRLKSILNLSAFGSHLHQLIATHEIGLQQHFVKYRSQNFDNIDSSSGLTGGFDLSWTASEYFKPSVGYIHERDTSISALTTGFTGVFYGSFETNIWQDYFLTIRGYLGNSQVFDITLEARI